MDDEELAEQIEEMESDLFAAIDLASDKLHRQIERYRGICP